MRQTQEIDNDEMIDEEEEVPDEEPPEDHMNKNEGKMAPLDALYPKMRVSTNDEKQKTTHRMSVIHESTHKEDVMTKTYQEDVVNKTYRENTMSAMHESTYQEDVEDKAYMDKVDVPEAVANTSSSYDGPEDPQNNCVTGKRGTKDDTKRLAVTAITSERVGRGA